MRELREDFDTGEKFMALECAGGRVDEGERFENVLLRELDEEIGLKDEQLIEKVEFYTFDERERYGLEGFNLLEMMYLVKLKDEADFKPVVSDEHEGYEWISKDTDLNQYEYKNDNQKEIFKKVQNEVLV